MKLGRFPFAVLYVLVHARVMVSVAVLSDRFLHQETLIDKIDNVELRFVAVWIFIYANKPSPNNTT
jgi:hypothetical protein